MKNVLIINAHQRYENFAEGKLNKSFVEKAKEIFENKDFEVKTTEIENNYHIAKEIEKHIWADIIITQSPFYWFGTPWIHKKYIDEVFTTALVQQSLIVDDGRTRKDLSKQYGTGGKMQEKKHMLSLTWNAPEEAFGDKKQNLFEGKTVDDTFTAISNVYKFCGADIIPAFSCHDVLKNAKVEDDLKSFEKHLAKFF